LKEEKVSGVVHERNGQPPRAEGPTDPPHAAQAQMPRMGSWAIARPSVASPWCRGECGGRRWQVRVGAVRHPASRATTSGGGGAPPPAVGPTFGEVEQFGGRLTGGGKRFVPFDGRGGGVRGVRQVVPFVRSRVELPFAVMLMRSAYNAVDALDFVAMDAFQRGFFLFRQDAWLPYCGQYAPLRVQQGDLQDPLYFDFISFAQAGAIVEAAADEARVFDEMQPSAADGGETFERVVVRRAPSLPQSAEAILGALPVAIGDSVYLQLRQAKAEATGLPGDLPEGAPKPLAPGAPLADVLAGVASVLGVFQAAAFLARFTVEQTAARGAPGTVAFRTSCVAPANLWGARVLALNRMPFVNAHPEMAVAAFLRASGVQLLDAQTAYSDTAAETLWTIRDDDDDDGDDDAT